MSVKISMAKEQEPSAAAEDFTFAQQFGADAGERKARALREVREALIAGACGDRVNTARQAGKASVTLPDGTIVSFS
jgi:hypothetical protein